MKVSKRDMQYINTLENKHGLGLQTYTGLLIIQGYTCAICGQEEEAKSNAGSIKRMAVDHDHNTDEVRGLLCQKCNTALGLFKDDADILKRAVEYLSKDHAKYIAEAGHTGARLLQI